MLQQTWLRDSTYKRKTSPGASRPEHVNKNNEKQMFIGMFIASVSYNDLACVVHFAETDPERALQLLDVIGAYWCYNEKSSATPWVFFCSVPARPLQSRSLRSGYRPETCRYPDWMSMTLDFLIHLNRNAMNDHHECSQSNTVQTPHHVQRAWASGLLSAGDSSSVSSTPCPQSEILLHTDFTNSQRAHHVVQVQKPISCFADQGSMTYRIPEIVMEVSAMLVARTILRHLADTLVQWHWECFWIRANCKMLSRPKTLEGSAETPAPREVRNMCFRNQI